MRINESRSEMFPCKILADVGLISYKTLILNINNIVRESWRSKNGMLQQYLKKRQTGFLPTLGGAPNLKWLMGWNAFFYSWGLSEIITRVRLLVFYIR